MKYCYLSTDNGQLKTDHQLLIAGYLLAHQHINISAHYLLLIFILQIRAYAIDNSGSIAASILGNDSGL